MSEATYDPHLTRRDPREDGKPSNERPLKATAEGRQLQGLDNVQTIQFFIAWLEAMRKQERRPRDLFAQMQQCFEAGGSWQDAMDGGPEDGGDHHV